MRLVSPRILVFGGTSLLLLIGLWLLFRSPGTTPSPANPAAAQPTTAGSLVFPTLLLYVHGPKGETQWTFTAVNASLSADQNLVQCARIIHGAFYENGAVVAHFTTGAATYDRTHQEVQLTGPIRIDAVNGARLECGSLHYSPLTRRLHAVGPLQITTKLSSFTAGALDADLALNELTFVSTPGRPVMVRSRLSPVIFSPQRH